MSDNSQPTGDTSLLNQPSQQTPPTETPSPTTEAPSTQSKNPADSSIKSPTEPVGAPEKYTDFALPEGFTANEEVMSEASGLFKELNLPQESAQRLVNFYSKNIQEALKAPYDLWQQTKETWLNDLKSNPEIGGKLDEVKTTVAKAIDQNLDPKLAKEFRTAMDFTGAGNHPAFVTAFYKLAQKLTEGTHVSGAKPSSLGQSPNGQGAPKSAAEAIYGPNGPVSGRPNLG